MRKFSESCKRMDDQAKAIALELVALYRDEVIAGADDPEATFTLYYIRLFEARYAGKVSPGSEAPGPAITSKCLAHRKPLPVVR